MLVMFAAVCDIITQSTYIDSVAVVVTYTKYNGILVIFLHIAVQI